jgi:ABC-2 type transport system permease protein
MVVLSFTLPIAISYLGDPDGGPIIGGYLGTFLLGGAYLAIGLFASTFTKDQISAFILGIAISFFLFFIGENFVLFAVPSFLVPVFKFLSLGWHFDSIGRGVIDLRDIAYYLSMIGFFLYMSIYSVESRKWR